jgi:hypothetical protein
MTQPGYGPAAQLTPNEATPSRMIDRLRDGAAVIYLEGIYDPRKPVPSPEWTSDDLGLGSGITTSRVNSSHRVTLSTVLLVDPLMYLNVMRSEPSLQFCREDKPGSYILVHPDTQEGQGGQWMPMVRTPEHWRRVANAPFLLAMWRTVLNLGLFEERSVEYLNGDRFDLRAANLRTVDA